MADTDEDYLGAGVSSTTSFSQLLLSDDDNDIVGIHMSHDFHYSSSAATGNPPKMLCFGDFHHLQKAQDDTNVVLHSEPTISTLQKSSGVTCSESSSTSSANNISNSKNVNTASRSTRKNGSSQKSGLSNRSIAKTRLTSDRTSKKSKTETPISSAQPKVRKEKLGERVTALQQLVSPFGKTDTASVLHEAMGYIRFLQDQVQKKKSEENGGEEARKDLKSRGLCLVPVEWTVHVASSNGADYWSHASGSASESICP
ncbi:transcription factor bHLH113 isoform X2 [Manihot esculenta]|uniref:Uncharacterized protein n=1 Tax=Manihot esculenta TaxID=3983 RepID=A0ACB7H0S7_MANES|nr:transcription factor bHLH113 isoform X2 [Manihot esculenta]KAG8645584.1 hypothetical protein MANES_10G076000v8 [Manihot esculenta]